MHIRNTPIHTQSECAENLFLSKSIRQELKDPFAVSILKLTEWLILLVMLQTAPYTSNKDIKEL